MGRVISRRRMLRGILGGSAICVALPPLEGMLRNDGTAFADGTELPTFYLTYGQGNGTPLDGFVPDETGLGFAMPRLMEPLEGISDYLTMVTGLENKHEGGHGAALNSQVTGSYDISADSWDAATNESIDNYLARRWAGTAPIRSINLGNSERGDHGSHRNNTYLSRGEGGSFNPSVFQPRELYNQMFEFSGLEREGAEIERARMSTRRAALDAIREDALSLHSQVGRADQLRLDEHLSKIADVEDAIGAFENLSCEFPLEPTEFGFVANREPLVEKHEVFTDLMALAFQCGITRVATYGFTNPQGDTIVWQEGATEGWHILTHDASDYPETEGSDRDESYQQVEKNFAFGMRQLAHLLTRFRDTPSGDGNLLDRACILGTFEMGEFFDHGPLNRSLFFVGRANGALVPSGHIRTDKDNAAKGLMTCLAAVGERPDSFGGEEAETSEAFEAVLGTG